MGVSYNFDSAESLYVTLTNLAIHERKMQSRRKELADLYDRRDGMDYYERRKVMQDVRLHGGIGSVRSAIRERGAAAVAYEHAALMAQGLPGFDESKIKPDEAQAELESMS